MIKLNDRFDFERDNYGWKLHEWRDGKDKDGNPKRQKDTTYHANLDQVCRAMIDKSAGHCESAEELREILIDAECLVAAKVKEVAA